MGKGILYEVEITAERDSAEPHGVRFTPKQNSLWKGGRFVFCKTTDKMKKGDCYLVQFTLNDKDDIGLRFPSQVANAMWVTRVRDVSKPECPTDPCYIDEFRALAVLGDHSLLAMNRDSKEEMLSFTLNFVRDGKSERDTDEYVPWDPISENRDGGFLTS